VIAIPPNAATGIGKAFFLELAHIQEQHPYCIFHVHGMGGFRIPFGLNLKAFDLDFLERANHDELLLPNGKKLRSWRDSHKYRQWVHLNGFRFDELEKRETRVLFNMKSALWAAENFNQMVKFRTTMGGKRVDPLRHDTAPPTTLSIYSRNLPEQIGDKVACDVCSLERTCKYWRVGGVCVVPGSDMSNLVTLFRSRDADRVIEGVAGIIEVSLDRLGQGRELEEDSGRLNPEVTKIINSIGSLGVKLAKLRNPNLERASVQVGIFNAGPGVAVQTPQLLTSAIVAELEAKGIAREDISVEMLQSYLDGRQRAIEVSGREDE
jgi:hypothetical protein